MTLKPRKLFSGLLTGLLLLYFISLLFHISANFEQYQWDFRTHRQAGEIFISGGDPYDADTLFSEARTYLLYTYPPVTLLFYGLFALTEYKTAFHLFLFFKFILLLALVYFWQREFLHRKTDVMFYVFCLLAFNSAVYRDIIAGNINLVEQVMLWLAFFFYLRHRLLLFCVFILIAASFKMLPAFFLVMLLISGNEKKYRYFFGSCVSFLAYLLIQYIVVPDMFTEFVINASQVVRERGEVAPSTYSFIRDVFRLLAGNFGLNAPKSIQVFAVVIAAAAVIFFSGKAFVRLRSVEPEAKEKIALFLVCLVYGLIHPRFKDYAYMLLLVPTYHIIVNARHAKAMPFILILCLITSPEFVLPGTVSFFQVFWKFYPLMVAYSIWGVYLYEIFAMAKQPSQNRYP
ncbi:MAG: DUF2029 domain-containing protein [Desulfobacterales bacterium]|nr:MAG: DUF2029 domain-containing protein [Desulfobacterales bacterium]